jgi:hypothetical protein
MLINFRAPTESKYFTVYFRCVVYQKLVIGSNGILKLGNFEEKKVNELK